MTRKHQSLLCWNVNVVIFSTMCVCRGFAFVEMLIMPHIFMHICCTGMSGIFFFFLYAKVLTKESQLPSVFQGLGRKHLPNGI